MLLQQQDRGRTETQRIYKDAAHNDKNIDKRYILYTHTYIHTYSYSHTIVRCHHHPYKHSMKKRNIEK